MRRTSDPAGATVVVVVLFNSSAASHREWLLFSFNKLDDGDATNPPSPSPTLEEVGVDSEPLDFDGMPRTPLLLLLLLASCPGQGPPTAPESRGPGLSVAAFAATTAVAAVVVVVVVVVAAGVFSPLLFRGVAMRLQGSGARVAAAAAAVSVDSVSVILDASENAPLVAAAAVGAVASSTLPSTGVTAVAVATVVADDRGKEVPLLSPDEEFFNASGLVPLLPLVSFLQSSCCPPADRPLAATTEPPVDDLVVEAGVSSAPRPAPLPPSLAFRALACLVPVVVLSVVVWSSLLALFVAAAGVAVDGRRGMLGRGGGRVIGDIARRSFVLIVEPRVHVGLIAEAHARGGGGVKCAVVGEEGEGGQTPLLRSPNENM